MKKTHRDRIAAIALTALRILLTEFALFVKNGLGFFYIRVRAKESARFWAKYLRTGNLYQVALF